MRQLWFTTTALLAGCNWVSLATNALTYHTMQRGEVGNLVARDSIVYATKGDEGFDVLDARTGARVASVPESADDLARDGDLLFVLDATPPGHVAVYSIGDPVHPRRVAPPTPVDVGPFSGVSASGGVAVVSGGTSQLTVWRYDRDGALTGPVATTDLGRGQPDVLVGRDGRLLFVSTHYRGPYFGLDIVRFDSSGLGLTTLAEVPLDGAGFTTGGAKPANFPIDVASLGPDTVLVAYARGLAVVDVTNPAKPLLRETVDLGGKAVNVDVRGREAAVSVTGSVGAIVIVDFSGPQARAVRRIPLPAGTFPEGVSFQTARVAVAARDQGVLWLDR